ncbi:NAD(P)/FAD-dependent oxidoreductase [Ideonella sp. DXS22W]|uniref:NAD(P)/FAD-dependent oxidoreductase n=1 Tax=Pseudaquabacterium inlustre TaxID=2984192 RepID=A0ABU9CPS3_9BURK
MHRVDAIVLGAGAAGLFCAGLAGQRGLKVLLIDHAERVAEKIRISGGGRCNFTNREATPAQFLSANPHFCRSALARYTPADFIALVRRHGIAFHEKHKGQLFCDDSAEQIIALLLAECAAGGVERWQPCSVKAVRQSGGGGFEIDTDRGPVAAPQLVIATGGLPVPKIGATDFGLRLARQFGLRVVEPRPALVPLTFDASAWAPFAALSGLSLEVEISTGTGQKGPKGKGQPAGHFVEDLLITHRGLSGPAVLQISSYWQPGEPLRIDLLPQRDLPALLAAAKAGSRRHLGNVLADWLPQRLADTWLATLDLPKDKPLPELRDRDLARLAEALQRWQLTPTGTEGWKKAEVMAGGVDTRDLDSRHLGARSVPGLHFIGEVVDVTGWLGGYNFQWAWSSAAACAQALEISPISE